MRRLNVFAVASALALLQAPWQVYALPVERQAEALAKARDLVLRYGHRASYNKGPAELCRLATKNRRARQTHPGKRGKS